VQGLLRLCADPDLARTLLEHREAWAKVHADNAATLAKMSKIRNVEAAQAKADAALKDASAVLERAKREADSILSAARHDAEEITRQAQSQTDGFAETHSHQAEREEYLQRRDNGLAERESAIRLKEDATTKAKKAADADRKAAREAKRQVEAMLKGVK